MDIILALNQFIDVAKSERKYADSTARGFKAAVKLFSNNINEAERGSFDTLLQNLDNIASDIYAKHLDDNITVTTLVVYKRRIHKLVRDYQTYGIDPAKMVGWDPRRHAKELSASPPAPAAALDQSGLATVSIKPMRAQAAKQSGLHLVESGVTPIEVNRSEIYIRPGFKFTLELPVDISGREAEKIKQLIDLLTMG